MQLDTLRLLLIKIGDRVRQLLTKVRLHLASGHPGQRLWYALSAADPELAHEKFRLDTSYHKKVTSMSFRRRKGAGVGLAGGKGSTLA
jgi:hypothetical protein